MAGRIRILDDALIDQIAAGEVVERPASVIKELLENAVDAGASSITVEIQEGGVSLMRVADDGIGMTGEEARLSVQRHATSKLSSAEDLTAVSTLGFRGEALPSIAAVSRFTLISRMRDEVSGARIRVQGGSSLEQDEVGCAPGTTVEVKDLFYNVPARRKFLKSRATESAHITTVCLRTALAFPQLRLLVTRDGRRPLEYLPASSFTERVRCAFPGENLVPIEDSRDGVHVTAALGAPERARTGTGSLHLFVNHRPVRDPPLARAVFYAYGSLLPLGRQPVGGVHVVVDPSEVDVNVHPQKLEVRFANSRAVFEGVTRLIAKALGTAAWSGPAARGASYWSQRLSAKGDAAPGQPVPGKDAQRHPTQGQNEGHVGADFAEGQGVPAPIGDCATDRVEPILGSSDSEPDPWGLRGDLKTESAAGMESGGTATSANCLVSDTGAQYEIRAPSGNPGDSMAGQATGRAAGKEHGLELLPATGFFGSLRVVGQVRRLFLICEGADALYIIDQHAADERVLFDRLRSGYRSREIETQRLLFPERVECSPLELTLIEEHQKELMAAGLDCSLVGPDTAAIHAMPALLAKASPERLLRDFLAQLERSGTSAFSAAVDKALATKACHGAVRAGDVVSPEQGSALLRALDGVSDFSGHCPHGRPVVHSIPLADLERRLGR